MPNGIVKVINEFGELFEGQMVAEFRHGFGIKYDGMHIRMGWYEKGEQFGNYIELNNWKK